MTERAQSTPRVVVIWCSTGSGFSGPRVAVGAGEPWLLTLEGTAERIPGNIDATDMQAVAAFYGAELAVVAPSHDFCAGVAVDGPRKGSCVYAIREMGWTTSIGEHKYIVVDIAPDVVLLELALDLGE